MPTIRKMFAHMLGHLNMHWGTTTMVTAERQLHPNVWIETSLFVVFFSTLVLSNPLLLDKIVGRGEEFYLRQFQQSVDRMFNSHLTSTSLADCQRRKSKLPGETEFKICCSCHTLKWTVLPPKYYYLYVPHKSLASSVPYSLAPRNCSCKNNDRKQVQI